MLQTAIEDFFDEFDGVIRTTTFITVNEGEIIAEDFITGAQINTLERFCNEIETAAETIGVPLSDELIRFILLGIIQQTGSTTGFESGIEALIKCLLEAGIIVDREPPSISNNVIITISSPNVQCTDDPLCAKLEPLKKYLVRNNMGYLWPS